MKDCSPELLNEFIKSPDAPLADKPDTVRQALLMIQPTADFQDFCFVFASRWIREKVIYAAADGALVSLEGLLLMLIGHCRSSLQKGWKQLLAKSNEALLAGVRGQVYEAHVHREFRRLSGQLAVRRLYLDGRVEETKITLPQLTQQRAITKLDDVKELKEGEYGLPTTGNFAAVDAVVVGSIPTGLQMTVSADHGYKLQRLRELKNKLGLGPDQPLRLVLVCPPDVYEQVRWQKLVDGSRQVKRPRGLVDGVGLEQYVLRFDWD